MKPEFGTMIGGTVLEIIGLLTLVTNEESLLPYANLGLEIPVILGSADIQGFSIFLIGGLISTYSIYQLSETR